MSVNRCDIKSFHPTRRVDRQKKEKAPVGVRKIPAAEHAKIAARGIATEGENSGIEYEEYADDFRSND